MKTSVNEGGKEQVHGYVTYGPTGEEYALNIGQVSEIVEYENVKAVSDTPPTIRGVLELRQARIPVVNPANMFCLAEMKTSRSDCILIIALELPGNPAVMGLTVDSRLLGLASRAGGRSDSTGCRIEVEYIRANGKIDTKFVKVFDIEKYLSDEEIRSILSLQSKVWNNYS